jgi:hypothetical protein
MAEHANKQKLQDGRSLVSDDPTLIATLAMRNLAEVFGENNPKRRRAAISEIYAEDAVVHAPPGAITGHDALDRFAGELRSTHPNFVYTRSAEPQVARLRPSGLGLGPRRRTAAIHRRGLRQDHGPLRLPGLAAVLIQPDSHFYAAADAAASPPQNFNQAQERLPWIRPVMFPSLAGC